MIKPFLFYKFNNQLLFCLCGLSLLIPSLSDAASTRTYSYDCYGNLQEVIDPRGFTTQYHYDCLTRVEQLIFPDGKNVKYSYDLMEMRGIAAVGFEPTTHGL